MSHYKVIGYVPIEWGLRHVPEECVWQDPIPFNAIKISICFFLK